MDQQAMSRQQHRLSESQAERNETQPDRPQGRALTLGAAAALIGAPGLEAATFTVTNPGPKGNLFGGAIISQPNVAILRMGEIKKRVVVIEENGEDRIVIHPVMYLALSYDHRVIDGVLGNDFLWMVADLLRKGQFEA